MYVFQNKKTGKYNLCERYTDPLTGKKRTASITIDKDTKQAINRARPLLEAKIAAAQAPKTQPHATTVKDLMDQYTKIYLPQVKDSTANLKRLYIARLSEALGADTLVTSLTAAYVSDRLTVRSSIGQFKAIMRWGYHRDIVQDIGFLDKIQMPKANKKDIKDKYLEPGEAARLLSALDNTQNRLLTEFLILSGLRIGEALVLRKTDIDLKQKKISVTKTLALHLGTEGPAKTESSIREVYIQPELSRCIRRILADGRKRQLAYALPDIDYLFFTADGRRVEYGVYCRYLRYHSQKCLGREITPHALRHTHASLLMEKGYPIDAISRRLGHENSAITQQIYLHVTEKLKEKENRALDKIKIL